MLYGLIVLAFSLAIIRQHRNGFSLARYSLFVFAILPIILGISGMGCSLYLFLKKPVSPLALRIGNVFRWILFGYMIFGILEVIILPIIQTAISVLSLDKIPERSDFLSSVFFIIQDYANDFLRGTFVTIELSFLGTVLGLLIAFVLVFFRTLKTEPEDPEILSFLKKAANWVSKLYVNVFRGTPMMVQAMIIYYVFPVILAHRLGIPIAEVDRIFTLMIAGITVVTLNTAAYLTEVLRGGIEAVEKGQLEAARSLGLGTFQSMFRIVFPQAFRHALPAIFNEFIINIKDTSVLNVIGVAELFFVTSEARYQYYRTYEPFVIVGLIYFALTSLASLALSKIEKHLNLEAKPLPSSN